MLGGTVRLRDVLVLQDHSQPGLVTAAAARWRWASAVLGATALASLVAAALGHPDGSRLPDRGYWVACAVLLAAHLRPLLIGGSERSWQEAPAALALAVAMMLRYAFLPAALPMALSVLVKDVLARKPPVRVIGNVSQYVVSLAATDRLLDALGWRPGSAVHGPVLLGVALAAAVVLYLVNRVLVMIALVAVTSSGVRAQWCAGLKADALTALATYALTPVLLSLMASSPALLPLFLVPLIGAQRLSWGVHEGQRLALVDPLTGLVNRRGFEDAIRQACGRGQPTVLMADLDGFKAVNDRWGHAVGDQLLRQTAARLLASVRPDDVVARLGGDEFAVLLGDGATPEDGERAAARLEEALRAPFVLGGVEARTTVSVGIARATDQASSPESLLDAADQVMYAEKRRRRADPQPARG
ncbi:MAG: GGDEF domain-containing protein [Mycobacteriales bacterium]